MRNRYTNGLLVILLILVAHPASGAEPAPREFRVWATSCSHVPADIGKGRESLAKAIRQSEGLEQDAAAFDWDIMIDAGDLCAHQTPPRDSDGKELQRSPVSIRFVGRFPSMETGSVIVFKPETFCF